jgi:Na+-transporting methylmalonyl-CoA/oxaloacetate decarboxylase gamma subunit
MNQTLIVSEGDEGVLRILDYTFVILTILMVLLFLLCLIYCVCALRAREEVFPEYQEDPKDGEQVPTDDPASCEV